MAPPAFPLPQDPEQADLVLVKQACDAVDLATKALDAALAQGYAQNSAKSRPAGALGLVITDLATLQTDLTAQQKQSAELNKELAKLQDQINQAKDSATVTFAKSALKFCGADPDSSAAASAAAPANAVDLQKAFPACVAQAGKDIDPLVKLAKHSHLADEIQSALTSILTANATTATSGQVSTPKIAASTTTALQTLSLEMLNP